MGQEGFFVASLKVLDRILRDRMAGKDRLSRLRTYIDPLQPMGLLLPAGWIWRKDAIGGSAVQLLVAGADTEDPAYGGGTVLEHLSRRVGDGRTLGSSWLQLEQQAQHSTTRLRALRMSKALGKRSAGVLKSSWSSEMECGAF